MSTLTEHVYFIKNIINRGTTSQNADFSSALIAHAIKKARALLIKRKMDKHQAISELNYQTICVDLEPVTYSNCKSLPEGVGCKVLRSKCKISSDVGDRWSSSITAYTILNEPIPKIEPITRKYQDYSRVSSSRWGYFVEDGYVYIVGNTKIKKVVVKGIWEDPESISSCEELSDDELPVCPEYGDEFPIDPDLVIPMYTTTLEILGISYRFAQDNLGDSRSVEQVSSRDPNE